jgi:hypothetical protein
VILLTEKEFIDRERGLLDNNVQDPLATRFAEGFTANYNRIARAKTIYAQLRELFRLVALAKIMEREKAQAKSGLNIDYLLRGARIASPRVSRALPGVTRVVPVGQSGKATGSIWLQSCGGVSMDPNVDATKATWDIAGGLGQLADLVISARPGDDALHWDFEERG